MDVQGWLQASPVRDERLAKPGAARSTDAIVTDVVKPQEQNIYFLFLLHSYLGIRTQRLTAWTSGIAFLLLSGIALQAVWAILFGTMRWHTILGRVPYVGCACPDNRTLNH